MIVLLCLQVYGYLKRLGYIVTRHGMGWKRVHPDAQKILDEEFEQRLKEKIARKEREGIATQPVRESKQPAPKTVAVKPAVIDKHPRHIPVAHPAPYADIFASLLHTSELTENKDGAVPMWDVYKPSPTFRKTDPGTPDFCVVTRNYNDAGLSAFDACTLSKAPKFGDETAQIKVAVVANGVISFLGLHPNK
jgi:hypothetical protein